MGCLKYLEGPTAISGIMAKANMNNANKVSSGKCKNVNILIQYHMIWILFNSLQRIVIKQI